MKKVILMVALMTSSLMLKAQVTDTGGNVGIGTTTPGASLEVIGKTSSRLLRLDVKNENAAWKDQININGDIDTPYGIAFSGKGHHRGGLYAENVGAGGDGNITLWSRANGSIILEGNKVGIGTTIPKEKLHLEGNLLIDVFDKGNESGIFFREGFSQSNKYNLSILTFDHNGSSADGLSMNAYDGISFSTGSGTRNERMRITQNGDVGIGTINTFGHKLAVAGGVILDDNLKFRYTGKKIGYYNDEDHKAQIQFYNSTNGNIEIENVWNGGNADIVLKPDNNVIVSNGNVGIGTTNTFGYKLAVNGNIGAKEIKVEVNSAWPDYVFSKEYQLPTLKEVEKHIAEKGHLVNIPSAKEVRENKGIELGKMNAKLLQKIEELTLYTIQQEKEIGTLKTQKTVIEKVTKENKDLKKRLERLEKLVNKLL
ncbi:hypothetical protein [uncultured Tenacibaculum sp.]|uniref:hypothetical protein n=1 Tax=uncultured Tenacibaculum sp. TaxID=174713 RepID=UPI00262CAD77|nr:hypothetical protein [uncultured Tenacibaculum sp.]